jgi:hypothetical protein
MLSLALVVLLGGTKVTASATGGLTLTTQERADTTEPLVLGVPLLSAQLDVEKTWTVGTLRGRLSPLVGLGPTFFFGGGTGQQPNPSAPPALQLSDLASFLEFESSTFGGSGVSLAVRLMPFQGNTRLVSFDWANAVTRLNAPVLSVDVRSASWHGWVAARFPLRGTVALGLGTTSVALYPEVLGGVGWRGERLRFEVRAGRTQYGPASLPMMMPAMGPLQWGFLAAGQAVLHLGEEVPPALDLVTYGQDPSRFERFFAPQPVPSGDFALTASLELGSGTQSISRNVMPPTESGLLPGWVDLQARLRVRQTRFFVTARAQSTAFLTFDLVSPGAAALFPPAGESSPLLAGYLGVDHVFHRTNLVPQLLLRVVQPATIRPEMVSFGGAAPPPGLVGGRLVILREGGVADVRTTEQPPLPTLGAKVALRWNPVPALAVVGEVDVALDLMTEVLVNRPGLLVPAQRAALTTTSTLALQGRF